MQKEVLVFISDGYADWESAYICAELNKPGTGFTVKTLALDKSPKRSMGGFTVLPDYSVEDCPQDFRLLILVGGTSWLGNANGAILPVLDRCRERKIPIAAICDACTFLAAHGFLDDQAHTGNSLAYIREHAPSYRGAAYFEERQAVAADGLITANGTSAVEFAREILRRLGVMDEAQLETWYRMFKIGYYEM